LKQFGLKIENLDQLVLIIKNWPNDVCVGYDGPLKPKIVATFLENDYTMIEEHIRLIEEQDFFEKIQALIFSYFRFKFLLSFSICVFFTNIFLVQS
jgi:hypothetical protein